MKAKNQQAVSPQVVAQADKIAKATQKPGQTKEQTRLIAKGIEKGIAEYKKREKAKARERDKQKKREQRDKSQPEQAPVSMDTTSRQTALLPWILLGLSWAGFLTYLSMA